MAYAITPLTSHTGAEITGLDLSKPLDTETRPRSTAPGRSITCWWRASRNTSRRTSSMRCRCSASCQPHDKKDHHIHGHPEMYYVTNTEFLGTRRMIPGETFHTDHSNHPRAPARRRSSTWWSCRASGGDTQYANMHLAYDELSEAMKRKIDGLKAVHVYLSKYSPRPLKPLNEESLKALPPAGIHPLVRVHPDNGRKGLFLNPVRIESDRRHARR